MLSRKIVAGLSAMALMSAGPALAQASAPAPERAAASLSVTNELGGEDGIGWAMGGLVLAGVAFVLLSIYVLDDDGDDDGEPVSP